MYFVNPTDSNLFLETQDGRLYIKLQAKDDAGFWRDLEYLPDSFCGNSYYSKKFNKKSFLEFTVPIFEGDLETKVRAKFTYLNGEGKIDYELVSNEIKSGINPGQFWRKENYYSQDVMDPYTE